MGATKRLIAGSALVCLVLALADCALRQQREELRTGVLAPGIDRRAFRDEWGPPTKAYSRLGSQVADDHWTLPIGHVQRGDRVYHVWEYDDREVTLLFHHYKLVAWRTEKTVEELRIEEE